VKFGKGAKVSPPSKFSGALHQDVRLWLAGMLNYLLLVDEPQRRHVMVAETYLEGAPMEQWFVAKPVQAT